jgi:hypothetical protein
MLRGMLQLAAHIGKAERDVFSLAVAQQLEKSAAVLPHSVNGFHVLFGQRGARLCCFCCACCLFAFSGHDCPHAVTQVSLSLFVRAVLYAHHEKNGSACLQPIPSPLSYARFIALILNDKKSYQVQAPGRAGKA